MITHYHNSYEYRIIQENDRYGYIICSDFDSNSTKSPSSTSYLTYNEAEKAARISINRLTNRGE